MVSTVADISATSSVCSCRISTVSRSSCASADSNVAAWSSVAAPPCVSFKHGAHDYEATLSTCVLNYNDVNLWRVKTEAPPGCCVIDVEHAMDEALHQDPHLHTPGRCRSLQPLPPL